MIEKFLIKRCSTEVQLMITRMKERPEDFDHGTAWRRLAESAEERQFPYTMIERKMIRAQWKKTLQQRKRTELLGRIMNETINPTPTRQDSLEDGLDAYKYQQQLFSQHLQQHYAKIQTGATGSMVAYTDPRGLYQQGYQSALQGRQQ